MIVMKRIIFMGTPVFATSVLSQLIQDKYQIVAVVCQPDKKIGRQQTIEFPPVKQFALEHNIPVVQPIRIRDEYELVLEYQPDLIITCAYGQMLPEILLTAPKFGCINIHASLLPRLRGGAPIHKAIIYGEEETGITIMKMAKKMDAGDMFVSKSTPILEHDTMGTLHDRLMNIAAEMIHEYIPMILDGTATFTPQKEEDVTFAYNISKEEEKIDFTQDFNQVYNHIRGLIPSPVSYALVDSKKIKFWAVEKGEATTDDVECGTITEFTERGIKCKAGNGYVYLQSVQLEGKKQMTAKEFMNGAGRSLLHKKFE